MSRNRKFTLAARSEISGRGSTVVDSESESAAGVSQVSSAFIFHSSGCHLAFIFGNCLCMEIIQVNEIDWFSLPTQVARQ